MEVFTRQSTDEQRVALPATTRRRQTLIPQTKHVALMRKSSHRQIARYTGVRRHHACGHRQDIGHGVGNILKKRPPDRKKLAGFLKLASVEYLITFMYTLKQNKLGILQDMACFYAVCLQLLSMEITRLFTGTVNTPERTAY